MEPKSMQIVELARRGGVSAATLRYYDEQGLLRPDGRTEAEYRIYGEQAACRLEFIQRAKALGLALRAIKRLLQDPSDPATDIARLRHTLVHKLADVERRIGELEALRIELRSMHARLGDTAPCGHLGDCQCWLPTGKEVNQMTVTTNSAVCDCCDCTCPSDATCSCCGCGCR